MSFTITIVTPSYNQGQFLGQTIESVISQEGDFFIDYIIADGGSTDESVEIIEKYEQLLKTGRRPVKCMGIDYRWWSRQDNGQSDAINQGLKAAKGQVLAWLNSDDFYEPQALAAVTKAFDQTPDAALIYGDCRIVNEDTGADRVATSKPGSFPMLLREEFSIYQPSTFFTRTIVDKVGLLDEKLHFAMDYDFWLRILEKGKSLYLSQELSGFRLWSGSKTSPQQEEALFNKKTEDTARDNGYDFTGKIKDSEYLLQKHDSWLRENRLVYAVKLRHLGTMNILAGNKRKALAYLFHSIKTEPNFRNVFTFVLALLGKSLYRWLLIQKRKAVKDVIHTT